MPLFNIEYLRNEIRQRQSYNRILTGIYTCPTQQCKSTLSDSKIFNNTVLHGLSATTELFVSQVIIIIIITTLEKCYMHIYRGISKTQSKGSCLMEAVKSFRSYCCCCAVHSITTNHETCQKNCNL